VYKQMAESKLENNREYRKGTSVQ